MNEIHSCSYYCERRECVRAQRDYLVHRFIETEAAIRFARTHDGRGFVLYVELEPPGPHVKSYMKLILSPNRADALHRALSAFLAEQSPPLEDTDG